MFKHIEKRPIGMQTSPWVIMCAAIILFIIVVVLAVQNLNREKRYMSQILSEKGAALIKAFEAGARTGMMGMMWGGSQIQNLLEETARQPDILYLIITDGNGRILAHDNRAKIYEKITFEFSINNLKPEDLEHWRVRKDEKGQKAFEVYRHFRPLSKADYQAQSSDHLAWCEPGMMSGINNWCFPTKSDENNLIIFVGLDMAPFEDARKEDIRNTVIISSILLLLGFGGFLSVTYAQSYRTTRRSLQDTSAFANEVVTNLPVGLIATDRNGKIEFFNSAAEKITGINFYNANKKDAKEVLPDHWCGLKEKMELGNPILEQEMECVFPNKEAIPLSVSATSIVNEEDEFVGNILILRDLGEVRMLQEEVRRKEKLAALGSMAAGVAHEIRNPLSSIKGMASYLGKKFIEGSDDREAADVMASEVDRVNRVISELLYYARPSALELKPENINKVLEHSLQLVRQDAQMKNIEIKWSGSQNLPRLLLDADRFYQCLLNLYLNAIQAMTGGGVLSIKSYPYNNRIKVEISDTGKGIAPENLAKIFDPYFTTKPSGTGLGLAISQKIIEAHRGRMEATSTPDKGTVVTITIPIHTN